MPLPSTDPASLSGEPAPSPIEEGPTVTEEQTTPSWAHPDTRPNGTYERNSDYISSRITADGRDGYPVEPGRYRLIAARACP